MLVNVANYVVKAGDAVVVTVPSLPEAQEIAKRFLRHAWYEAGIYEERDIFLELVETWVMKEGRPLKTIL